MNHFEKMTEHNISVIADPDWYPNLGNERWLAIQNMKYDAGSMGSEYTGWMAGDGFTGDVVARAETPSLAVEECVAKIEGSSS